jgi:hypothetical protein
VDHYHCGDWWGCFKRLSAAGGVYGLDGNEYGSMPCFYSSAPVGSGSFVAGVFRNIRLGILSVDKVRNM